MTSGAGERLRRLLAVVPWVAAHDGPTIEEVCRRFDYTEEELVDDLEKLFLCGLYPFTPDTLIEVDIADGRVWIRFAEIFAKPLRLTPAEALAVVAAGAALLHPSSAMEAAEPLARGITKLASALGIDPDEMVEVELGGAPSELLAALQVAAAERHQVKLEYYSYGRDEWTERVIDPHRVFSSAGQWYVNAHCHRVDDRRLFRVDRMRAATALDTTFDPPAEEPGVEVFAPRKDDPLVALELAPAAAWVAEQYPYEKLTRRKNGGLRLSLRISERAWLERLLLRLGPDARVVAGDGSVGPDAARRVLMRYRRAPLT